MKGTIAKRIFLQFLYRSVLVVMFTVMICGCKSQGDDLASTQSTSELAMPYSTTTEAATKAERMTAYASRRESKAAVTETESVKSDETPVVSSRLDQLFQEIYGDYIDSNGVLDFVSFSVDSWNALPGASDWTSSSYGTDSRIGILVTSSSFAIGDDGIWHEEDDGPYWDLILERDDYQAEQSGVYSRPFLLEVTLGEPQDDWHVWAYNFLRSDDLVACYLNAEYESGDDYVLDEKGRIIPSKDTYMIPKRGLVALARIINALRHDPYEVPYIGDLSFQGVGWYEEPDAIELAFYALNGDTFSPYDKIGNLDDVLFRDLKRCLIASLSEEKYYNVAHQVAHNLKQVDFRVNVAGNTCTMEVEGLDDFSDDFIKEVATSLTGSGKNSFEYPFISGKYNNSTVEFNYKFNDVLYAWQDEVFIIRNGVSQRLYISSPPASSVRKEKKEEPPTSTPEETAAIEPEKSDGPIEINVYAYSREVWNMFKKYAVTHPDFDKKYKLNCTFVSTDNDAYQIALDAALQDDGAPNLYMAEAAFVKKYTTGSASKYACTYEDLGIDVEIKIKDAGIAQYTADITRNGDGKVVALGYQGYGGAFIYNRDVAKDVFGDDKPETVEAAIGKDWDSFFKAAEKCKAKGYAIVSGDGDIWHAIENSSDKGWVVDGKLYIDPRREAFFDYAKKLKDNGYHNDTQDWSEGWYADMAENGSKKVLGFYGPAWLINDFMYYNCGDTAGHWGVCKSNVGFFWGGTWLIANKNVLNNADLKAGVKELIEYVTLDTTETGLQYEWANAKFSDTIKTKDVVASGVVMGKSDGTMEFLGGQDAFPVFVEGCANAKGDNLTEYDEKINAFFRDAVRAYTSGEKTREEAINWFKQQVMDNIGAIGFSAEKETTINLSSHIGDVEIGDYITFGSYEQDNNFANGKEAIEWMVLDKQDDKILVISRYGLDYQPYNTELEEVTWETCTLRNWLNSSFYDLAFTNEEKSAIPLSAVTADANPYWDTPAGNDTMDRVFLLSYDEAKRYFGDNAARECRVTPYSYAQGANLTNGGCFWGLRTPGESSIYKVYVDYNGIVDNAGGLVSFKSAVRPALWISLIH